MTGSDIQILVSDRRTHYFLIVVTSLDTAQEILQTDAQCSTCLLYTSAWELTRKETKGKEERTDKFLPDPDVRGAKAYSNDYTKSGYDRGHMAPAADMKWSKPVSYTHLDVYKRQE